MNPRMRMAQPDDAPAISGLVQASFRAHIARDWQAEAQDAFLSETTAQKLAGPIAQATFAAVYEQEGRIVGVILLPRPNLVQLCFVATTHLRRGIGTALWEAARTYLETQVPEIKTVELNASPYAVAAYTAMGFFPISRPYRRKGAVATRMACWLPGRALESGRHGRPVPASGHRTLTDTMITLYHSPGSRSSTFVWLLEELGVDYGIVYCDIKRRSGKGSPDPKNVHPEKRVPALVHDGQLVTEQMAIALYLTDAFPAAGLGRSIGAADRASYLTWLAFFAGEADPIYNTRLLYGAGLDPMTLRDHGRVVGRVDAALSAGPFLMGDTITAADILMSGPFGWDSRLAPGNDRIGAWLKRLADRPAAKRAAELDERPAEPLSLDSTGQ